MPYRRFSVATGSGDNQDENALKSPKPAKRLSLPSSPTVKKSPTGKKPRIPKSLQNVFLASAKGEDVTEAPVKDKSFIKKLGKSKSKKKKKALAEAESSNADQPTSHHVS